MGTRCPQKCKFIQFNLHQNKTAGHSFAKNLLQGRLTQEPWLYGDQRTGMHSIRGHCFLLDLILLQDPAFTSEAQYVPFCC